MWRLDRLSSRTLRRLAIGYVCWLTASGGRLVVAATFTWTGGSPFHPALANNWSNPLNWQAGQIPVDDGTADVIIPDTPRDNPDVDQPWSISTLTFQGSGNYTLGEDPLTVNAITHNGTGTVTFDNSINVFGSNAAWTAASGPMTFSGAITGSNALSLEAAHPIRFEGAAVNALSGTVTVNSGTLILSKSSFNGAIAGNLAVDSGVARWDASDQVSESLSSLVSVRNGGVVDFQGKNETLGQLALSTGGRVESTGGQVEINGQLGLQGASAVDLGAGELRLQVTVNRSGNAVETSRIDAGVIRLTQTQTVFNVSDGPGPVELEVNANIAGALSGALLKKTGPGALRLLGASTYQGGTIVDAGALIVDNSSGSATGSGTVTVNAGALLTGDGAAAGPVSMQGGAVISPSSSTGFPIGSLNIGGLSMNSASELQVQFNHALPPTLQRDVLTVANLASLNGNLTLENLNSTLLPSAGAAYTILAATTLTGAFANVAAGARLATIDGSGSFIVNYGVGSPFNPNHVVLSDFEVAALPGDFDLDGDVDGADFLTWQRGQSPHPASASDLAEWRAHFGDASGPVLAVPEPSATLVILCGIAFVCTDAFHWRAAQVR